jgi:hypothetical protein|tara:strand:+ start:11310 stop:11417 length:108 start_codon:yes stop_codon:yes gene_type:complete
MLKELLKKDLVDITKVGQKEYLDENVVVDKGDNLL